LSGIEDGGRDGRSWDSRTAQVMIITIIVIISSLDTRSSGGSRCSFGVGGLVAGRVTAGMSIKGERRREEEEEEVEGY